MSNDDTREKIFYLGKLKRESLSNIEKWNQHVPLMQKDLQYQEWMEKTVEQEPNVLFQSTDEILEDMLSLAKETLPDYLYVPSPPDDLGTFVTASGTALPARYYRYVDSMENTLNGHTDVLEWAKKTKAEYKKLNETHNISLEVRSRVSKLRPILGKLHQKSTDAVLKCSAKQIEPALAAVDPRRLLEQFKGNLIAKCKSGKKSTYKRIADNLAADSEMTKVAIESEQETYDKLSVELTHILKRMKTVDHDYLQELFRQLEDHIMVVTSAIDPNKIGFSFAEE